MSTATGDKTSLYQPNEFETLDSLNQSTKKVKEVSYNYKDLQEIYSELILLSLSQGKATTLYGAGIHILGIIKMGGTNLGENIDNTIADTMQLSQEQTKSNFQHCHRMKTI